MNHQAFVKGKPGSYKRNEVVKPRDNMCHDQEITKWRFITGMRFQNSDFSCSFSKVLSFFSSPIEGIVTWRKEERKRKRIGNPDRKRKTVDWKWFPLPFPFHSLLISGCGRRKWEWKEKSNGKKKRNLWKGNQEMKREKKGRRERKTVSH